MPSDCLSGGLTISAPHADLPDPAVRRGLICTYIIIDDMLKLSRWHSGCLEDGNLSVLIFCSHASYPRRAVASLGRNGRGQGYELS